MKELTAGAEVPQPDEFVDAETTDVSDKPS